MRRLDQPLPLDCHEGRGLARWLAACARTLARIMMAPWNCFAVVRDPVDHARTLAFLATLRLPTWIMLQAILFVSFWRHDPRQVRIPEVTVLDAVLGYQFVEVASIWLLLMVPIGLPLLYFFGGIAAHVALGLTGGARRNVGTSMRAFGLALAPAMLLVGIVDIPLHLHLLSPELWLVLIGGVCLPSFFTLGLGLARTHQTRIVRGLLVAVLPIAVFFAACTGRALLELERAPFGPEPEVFPYDGPRFEIE